MSLYEKLGTRLADFSSSAYTWSGFTKGAYSGQCVTYVRGRAKEKLGHEFKSGASSAKLLASVAKSRGYTVSNTPTADSFIVWNEGRYSGDKWGHVYYCEGISGDDYFYTEANANNDGKVSSDDGVLKKGSLKALLANKYFLGFVYFTSSKSTDTSAYTVGKNYTLKVNLKVRTGAGVSYSQKKTSELSADGKSHAKSGEYAVLKAGTVVTVKEVKEADGDIWIKIPSGWIAAKYNGETYVS